MSETTERTLTDYQIEQISSELIKDFEDESCEECPFDRTDREGLGVLIYNSKDSIEENYINHKLTDEDLEELFHHIYEGV